MVRTYLGCLTLMLIKGILITRISVDGTRLEQLTFDNVKGIFNTWENV